MLGSDAGLLHGGLLLAACLSVAGCAHYKLGTTPPEHGDRTEISLSVSTVGVPADWGVDGPRLTRQLVEELRARGLANADWESADDESTVVQCVIDGGRPDASEVHQRARVVARCDVSGADGTMTFRAAGRQTTSSRSGRVEPRTARRTALEFAAVDALEQVAGKIARTLESQQAATNGTRDGQTAR